MSNTMTLGDLKRELSILIHIVVSTQVGAGAA